MAHPALRDKLRAILAGVDPRRSFGAAAIWLIVALAATFSIAAAIWVGSISRRSVLEQHIRRLALETDQLGSDLGQAMAARLGAVRAAGAMAQATGKRADNLPAVFEELTAAYPSLDWIAAADAKGMIVASQHAQAIGSEVAAAPWFSSGIRAPWLGVAGEFHRSDSVTSEASANLGDLAIPVEDGSNSPAGVIITHVRWRRAAHHPERLTDEPDPRTTTEICVIDKAGLVLVGPAHLLGKPWPGVPVENDPSVAGSEAAGGNALPRFERLPDGRRVLVARSALAGSDEITGLGWRVQLNEPNERVFQRADALALQILWVSLCLGLLTAVLGTIGARHLTRRLKQLAVSVTNVGQDSTSRIEVPNGADEVARLGQAFAALLHELALERNELERRVAVRTREVERLADESRYAAIVRERLTIARDLHDTLAHSMMAILSEIRFSAKTSKPGSPGFDQGAGTRRAGRPGGAAGGAPRDYSNALLCGPRDGSGTRTWRNLERFLNLTGLVGDFQADASAARFGDERAETILRMVGEALRNIERHARATEVRMRLRSIDESSLELRIEDNGIGFDPQQSPPGHYGIVGLREQAD